MASSPAPALFATADLLAAWRGNSVWRMLDTGFGNGGLFFTAWKTWAADPHRPRLLHYVAITPVAPDREALLCTMAAFPALAAHSTDLERQWMGLLPGFHRIALHQGQMLLTLCIGPLQAMLREQRFVADWVCLPSPFRDSQLHAWDRWCTKALTRLCRRGTAICVQAATTQLRGHLVQAGFAFEYGAAKVAPAEASGDEGVDLHGQYQPHWEPGSTRHPWRVTAPAASACVVLGAGLAGALVAAALARRGWQVTVLDAAAQPAGGASGLPVGIMAPQVSRDDSTRSRLSRAGVRATLDLCHTLLQQGEDWSVPGVLERRPDGGPGLPDDWPAAGRQWSDSGHLNAEATRWSQGPADTAAPIWHTPAGWIKPARLVQACLSQSGVQFVGKCEVYSITRDAGQWLLLGAAGTVLARATQLVAAAAGNSVRLLEDAATAMQPSPMRIHRLAVMGALDGQISWATQQSGDADEFPPFPVNGLGSFVAHVPVHGAQAWFAGATYDPCTGGAECNKANGHRDNLERLSQLLPKVAHRLAQRFAGAQIQAWSGTRCTTIDRMPAVGPLDAGSHPCLWVSTGMGSRGLTYAALCAELLAAQMGGEPLPVEASLARTLAATRPRLLDHL